MAEISIKKALSDYGLTDDEIKIYLALLRSKSATVREISLSTGIKRTTIYLIAEKLVFRGILGQYKAKYGTHYTLGKPEELLSRLENISVKIKDILPELKAIEKKAVFEPSTRFYKGQEGYLKAVEESLEGTNHEVLYFGDVSILNQVISEKYILKKYIPIRIRRKIKFRQLVLKDEFSETLKETAKEELREIKFLPPDFKVSANKLIYHDKVAYFTSERELSTVIIESQDIAETERRVFEALWSNF